MQKHTDEIAYRLFIIEAAKGGDIIFDINCKPDTNTAIGQNSGLCITVGFFGSVRETASAQGLEVLLDCKKSVYGLLKELAVKYGEIFAKEIFSAENPEIIREDVMLTLNRKILHHAKTKETILKDRDKLEIFPIFPGGG